jgi:uncharacterized protein YjdB
VIARYKKFYTGSPALAYTPPAQASMKKSEKPYLSLAAAAMNVIGVHLNKAKLKLKTGQAETLVADVLPVHATKQALTWHITNPAVAELEVHHNKAVIKGKQAGRAIVIASTEDNSFRDLCIVTVHDYLLTNK